ncbi:MAG: VWA domain-containing protein [Oceanospirillales bacterium]|nr:MAG: VWA domain-containing protein [Oceanospirillales bacterium]
MLMLLLIWAPASADLSQLEGTHGHSTLHELEGTLGHEDTSDPSIICTESGPCLEAQTQVPLRVLPRPFSNLYSEASADPTHIKLTNMPSFHPLYVFARVDVDLNDPTDPKGWYEVGRSQNTAEGWMQAKDLLEWRQALLVSYTHPGSPIEGRHPVLMFTDKNSLSDLIDDFDMASSASSLYQAIESGEVPDTIVSMEPQRFIDITRQFYVLPILQWEQTRIDGDDVRLLQIAAAVPGARGADTLEDENYRQQATTDRGSLLGNDDLNIDIVFVIDTTRSMQPFIDMTKDAVMRVARSFGKETEERVRFGLVTFRDSTDVIPQIGYVSRNWTPEMVRSDALITLLEEEVKATQVGSLDYAEEVFAGVDTALRSNWRDGALRFMFLIGDASSHPKGHPQNVTGKDETELRREADDQQVHITAIHLKDPRAEEDHPIAEAQFSHLARIRGSRDESAYESVNAFDEDDFHTMIDGLSLGLINRLAEEFGEALPDEELAGLREVESVSRQWEAALVEYIGRAATPPKDIIAWVMDRDLINPVDRSLDVRVLVTRDQLSTLAQSLDQVVQALMRAEVTQAQFFEALQSVSGQTMKRPEGISDAPQLADAGLLPAFIQSLPYKSDILSLTDEMFASMTADQRSQLEWSILAKLEQYRTINEQVDAWFRLNETDADSELVYPLHLDYLP